MEINQSGRPPMPAPQAKPEALSQHIMKNNDANKDGIIDSDELGALGEQAQKLLVADADQDGSVTQQELVDKIGSLLQKLAPEGPPPRPEKANPADVSSRLVDKYDLNDDGALNDDELANLGDRAERFAGADADGDGLLTQAELTRTIAENLKSFKQNAPEGAHIGRQIDQLAEQLQKLDNEDAQQLLGLLKTNGFDGFA